MALSTITLQPASGHTHTPKQNNPDTVSSLLSAILLTMYAGQKSRKQLRKLKRRVALVALRQKLASLFRRSELSERQIIIYILIGVLILALIIAEPIAALVLAIVGLILFLTGTI